ncbi:xylose isomerase-like protein [Blastocladiella britannica]|nr:xylose isomerase-like protein [Blastocladiella britannica]
MRVKMRLRTRAAAKVVLEIQSVEIDIVLQKSDDKNDDDGCDSCLSDLGDSADEEEPISPKKGAKKKSSAAKRKRAAAKPLAADDDATDAILAPQTKRRKKSSKTTTTADIGDMTVTRLVNPAKLIGAHVSAAGGLQNAIPNALKIGANAMSFFLKSSRTWNCKPLEQSTIDAFRAACASHGYDAGKCMIPHGSYLVNLGNPDEEKREKSYVFFLDELKRCEALGITLYNFHPGSTVGECTPGECLQHIANCVNRALAETTSVTAVIENTAGQGNTVGHTFEQLRDLIAMIDDKERVGVCLDTCHMFAAGYDLRTKATFDASFALFDEIVGNGYLKAFHVNDSKAAFASKKDRHAQLGQGMIGMQPFRWLMEAREFDDKLFILETPDEALWVQEIAALSDAMGSPSPPSSKSVS